MTDNYAKFRFEIQLLHMYHESNGDSVYTFHVYKIYPNRNILRVEVNVGVFFLNLK